MQGKFGAYSAQSTLARKRLSPWRSFNSPKQGSTIVVRRRYFACRSTSDINSPVSLRRRRVWACDREATRYIFRAAGSPRIAVLYTRDSVSPAHPCHGVGQVVEKGWASCLASSALMPRCQTAARQRPRRRGLGGTAAARDWAATAAGQGGGLPAKAHTALSPDQVYGLAGPDPHARFEKVPVRPVRHQLSATACATSGW